MRGRAATIRDMPLSRSCVAPALAAAASILLHGCDPMKDALPTGQPPPAGFAADMLAAHNAIRADPASVGGSPAPSPALPPLAWNSTEVAARAQAWASGCDYRHDTTALRALGYGENIAAAYPPGSFATADVVSGLWAERRPSTPTPRTPATRPIPATPPTRVVTTRSSSGGAPRWSAAGSRPARRRHGRSAAARPAPGTTGSAITRPRGTTSESGRTEVGRPRSALARRST